MFCFCILLIYFKGFLSDQLSQNPPNRQIFTVCRTVAVNDQSEISFLISQGILPQQPNFVGFSARVSLYAGS